MKKHKKTDKITRHPSKNIRLTAVLYMEGVKKHTTTIEQQTPND